MAEPNYSDSLDDLLFGDPRPRETKPGTYGDHLESLLSGPPQRLETEQERQQRLQGYSDIYRNN